VEAPSGRWPSLLGSREGFPPDVSAAVERVWSEPTLSRTVIGRSARVPLDVYVAFLATPEVTAAAARFRKLGRYEIQALDDNRYWASDGDGARGFAQVLRREPRRLVVLSQGEHTGPFLGAISGSALTVLDLEAQQNVVVSGSRPMSTSTTRPPLLSLDCSSRPSGSSLIASSARGFASLQKSPNGRSTSRAVSARGSHASRFRKQHATAF
jgi:hypothetical protein